MDATSSMSLKRHDRKAHRAKHVTGMDYLPSASEARLTGLESHPLEDVEVEQGVQAAEKGCVCRGRITAAAWAQ